MLGTLGSFELFGPSVAEGWKTGNSRLFLIPTHYLLTT